MVKKAWALPFGAIALVRGLSTLALAIVNDMYIVLPAAVIAGLAADVLIWRLKPSENRRFLPLIAFVIPALLFAVYMLTFQLAAEIGWSIHVWTGAIFLAGLTGLLLNALMAASSTPELQPSIE